MGSFRDCFEATIRDPASYGRLADLLHSIDEEFLGQDLEPAEEARWLALRQPVLDDLRATMTWAPPLPLRPTEVTIVALEPPQESPGIAAFMVPSAARNRFVAGLAAATFLFLCLPQAVSFAGIAEAVWNTAKGTPSEQARFLREVRSVRGQYVGPEPECRDFSAYACENNLFLPIRRV